jgi:hypothetical protein
LFYTPFPTLSVEQHRKEKPMSQYNNVVAEYERSADVEYTRSVPARSRREARPSYARSGNRPSAYNGIHRRRRKHWNW